MSFQQLPRKAALALAGALALGLAVPSFAGPDGAYNEFASSRIEVRFLDASGDAVQLGSLKVYDNTGTIVDAAQPDADGLYILGPASRGKLRLEFSNAEAVKQLSGFASAETLGGGAGVLTAMLDSRIDFAAALMGVTPRASLTVGDMTFAPDFPFDPSVLDTTRSAGSVDSPSGLRRLPGSSGPSPTPTPSVLGGLTCATAAPLTLGGRDIDTLSNAGVFVLSPMPNCPGASLSGRGKYWTFTAAAGNNFITLTTGNSPSIFTDTTINVYRNGCATPICVAGDDQNPGSNLSTVEFCAVPGTQYWVQVSGWFGFSGGQTFFLDSSASAPPSLGGGATCEAAVPLTAGVPVEGSTLCDGVGAVATVPDCSLPYGPALTGDDGAYFTYHSVNGGRVKVTTGFADRFFDTQLRVLCTSCPVTTCVASDDDSGPNGLFSSELQFQAQPDADYTIVLSGWNNEHGNYRILVTEADTSQAFIVHPDEVPTPLGPNDGDGQQFGAACKPVGAVCIKCLDEANCFENIDRSVAEKIGGDYFGDDTKCIGLQGPDPVSFVRNPGTIIRAFAPFTDTTDFMAVPLDGAINKLTVGLNINHTWIGDMIIDLKHEDTGRATRLWERNSCPTDNIFITIDDDAPVIFFCVDSAVNGTFSMPAFFNTDLTQYKGENALGTWSARLRDLIAGDGGVWNSWRLNFDSRVPVANCGPANNGLGNGVDAQPGRSDNCNDCPK